MIKFWISSTFITLFLLAYQDYKNNMMVNNNRNIFMLGFTIMFACIMHTSIYMLFAVVIISILLGLYIGKFKLLGRADANTIMWLFMGYASIGTSFLFVFFIVSSIIVLLWAFMKKLIFKIPKPTPFYGVLLIIHTVMAFIILW